MGRTVMSTDPIAGGSLDSDAFDPGGIGHSPNLPGTYMLFNGRHTIYIGMSDDIRGALESHRSGEEGTLTSHATTYWCAPSGIAEASMRKRQLIETYKASHNLNPPAGNRDGASRLLAAIRVLPKVVEKELLGNQARCA